jgi:hypothetical protein
MTQTIELFDLKLKVEFEYYFSKGLPNVYPDREELTIISIYSDDDLTKMLDSHSRTATIYEVIKETLLPYARDYYKD